jgi:hypothetical protein
MAVEPTQGNPLVLRSIDELTVAVPCDDLLLIDPLDLGPGAPATAALALERGPQPASSSRPRGDA